MHGQAHWKKYSRPEQRKIKKTVETGLYKADKVYVCKHKVARPNVFIPVFPGTNCEYDSAKAFERAGADVSDQGI